MKNFSSNKIKDSEFEVKLTYISENNKIAKVSKTGMITSKKTGSTNVFIIAELANGTKVSFSKRITVHKE